MNLDELERIGKEAIPVPWRFVGGMEVWAILDDRGYLFGGSDDLQNGEFIATARNYWDRLIAIARAAEDAAFYYGGDEHSGPARNLVAAIATLKDEK